MQSGSLGRRMRVRVRLGEGGDEALLDTSELRGGRVCSKQASPSGLRARRANRWRRHWPVTRAARARREDGRDATPLGMSAVSAGCAGYLL